MKNKFRIQRKRGSVMLVAGAGLSFLLLTSAPAWGADDYNSRDFGGSSYVQRGPGPAYSGGYTDYGGNATGIEGRFSVTYGEAGAVPGYARFGAGSSYGTGPLRAAGTGRGAPGVRQKSGNQKPRRKAPDDFPF